MGYNFQKAIMPRWAHYSAFECVSTNQALVQRPPLFYLTQYIKVDHYKTATSRWTQTLTQKSPWWQRGAPMRLDALKHKTGWHKAWPTKRKDGDKEGIVVRAEEKELYSLGAALHSNHTSASDAARPIKCIHHRSGVLFLIRCKQRRTAF